MSGLLREIAGNMNVVMPNSELNMTVSTAGPGGIIRALRGHTATGTRLCLRDDYRRMGVWTIGDRPRSQ
jgi:hypothetical protein